MGKVLDKLFYLNAWTVGYRKIENQKTELPSKQKNVKYDLVSINDHIYYADPFVFEDGEDTYLFTESMNRYRGIATLSVSKYENGKFGKFTEILCEPFHLSYPNVFKYRSDYYMIPETSQAKQIRLYRATKFPYSWELHKVLLDNGKAYTDNAIEVCHDGIIIYTYIGNGDNGITECYHIDPESKKIEKICNNIHIQNDRPAGNPFCINGKSYRPLQDCGEYYGRAINIFSYGSKSDEALVTRITKDCYDINVKNITGTHTINRSEHFEAIDVKFNRFCVSSRWIWLINKVKRK